jgi:hypothetical protein
MLFGLCYVMRKPRTISAKKSTRTPIVRFGFAPQQVERFELLVDERSGASTRVSVEEINKEIEESLRKTL